MLTVDYINEPKLSNEIKSFFLALPLEIDESREERDQEYLANLKYQMKLTINYRLGVDRFSDRTRRQSY